MNRFFRSALFPLIVIVLLVYLASQTLHPEVEGAREADLLAADRAGPERPGLDQSEVVFNPSKHQIGHAER